MFFLVGIGLEENDITIRGIEAIKKCDIVYVEFYTNSKFDINYIAKLTGKKIMFMDREGAESDFIIKKSRDKNVALLVPGDPITATTHFELINEAKKQGIETKIIHAPSIYTAVAECGLHLYKFGRTTTLAKPHNSYEPKSPYEVIEKNRKAGLHSLILMDIGMSASDGINLLVKNNSVNEKDKIIVCSCIGGKKQKIKYGSAKKLRDAKFSAPVTIVIPGELNFKEEEYLDVIE